MASFERPDVLVLGAGGVLGEAWMTGVLGGIEDGARDDLRDVESLLGTSAGAIVAARLAAGRSPRRPDAPLPERDEPAPEAPRTAADLIADGARAAAGIGWAATAPVASAALAAGAPAGALVRAALLARAPAGAERLDDVRAEIEALGSRFDGRLRVAAVERSGGRRVVFGAPGAPAASVTDAVVASCSIPGRHTPAVIEGREYVDGGAWSATNLDAAPAARDTLVLCLDPIAGLPSPASRGLAALRAAQFAATQLELQGLRARGARVRHIHPEGVVANVMGRDLMDARPADRVLADGYRQGLAIVASG